MKAAVVARYGPPEVVSVAEVPQPAPGRGEVLVAVRAAAVTSGDARIRAGRFPRGMGLFARAVFGFTGPRRPILGGCFSGEVVAVGADVADWSPGAEVCGMTGTRMGAHAQFVAVPADRAVAKPEQVSHQQAAGVLFGGTTALAFLRDKAHVQPGWSVLVNGASGAVGSNAVQLAAHFGGTVTAVTSTPNVALVEELGADRVIDYTRTPVADVSERFDVVFDTVGNLTPGSGRRLLTDRGVLLLAVADLPHMVRARGNVKAGPFPERAEDFALLVDLVSRQALKVVIEEVLPLDRIGAAYERIDSGRKVGNLIVEP